MAPKPQEEKTPFIPSDLEDEEVDPSGTDQDSDGDDEVASAAGEDLDLPENDSDDDPDDEIKQAAKAATLAARSAGRIRLGLNKKIIQALRAKTTKTLEKKRTAAAQQAAEAESDTAVVIKTVAPRSCALQTKAGPDDHSRLVSTTLETDNGRIDMVVAVTQKLLNNRLKYFWALEEKMQSVDVELPSGEAIRSFLLPPKLHLEVESNRPGAAVYYLSFDYGGYVKLRDPESGEFRNLSTDNWVFAFDVDIALEGLEDDSDEYGKVKSKLGAAGDFRISRLVADFETADIMNPRIDLCSFGEAELDDSAIEHIKALLDGWRDLAVEEGLGLMGWSATMPAESKLKATFTPTYQQLQTYPYMAPGQDKPVVGLDDPRADYNMLLYLTMADGRTFPEDRFLDYSGNFCTPLAPVQAPKPPEIHASLVIGKDVFFANFVLEHLTFLNRASWIKALKPGLEYKGGGMVVHWNEQLGSAAGEPDDFFSDWKPASGEDWVGWEWKKSSRGYNSRRKRALGRITGEMKTSVVNRVRVHPKGNVIKVDHLCVVSQYTMHRRAKTREGRVEVRRQGTMKIHIESVKDGQSMKMRFPTPDDLFTSEVTRFDSGFIGTKKDTLASQARGWMRHMQGSPDFDRAVKQVQAALENVNAFVIPTGGTFFLRDALFNDECDLLLKASYNGID